MIDKSTFFFLNIGVKMKRGGHLTFLGFGLHPPPLLLEKQCCVEIWECTLRQMKMLYTFFFSDPLCHAQGRTFVGGCKKKKPFRIYLRNDRKRQTFSVEIIVILSTGQRTFSFFRLTCYSLFLVFIFICQDIFNQFHSFSDIEDWLLTDRSP